MDQPVSQILLAAASLQRLRSATPKVFGTLFAFLLTCFSTCCLRADLTVNGYANRFHDRFYVGADRAFIGDAYNWSGVGRVVDPIGTKDANWKTVTMISDNWVITDQHHHPMRADDPAGLAPKVRFYRTNDTNGEYWESELATTGGEYVGSRVGNSDLWVGKLANMPPAWVMRYPLAKRQENTNYLSYTDNHLYIFGQDSPRSLSSVRVGRNEISEISLGGEYSWGFDSATGLGRDEAQTEMGDSGSPSFFINGGLPVLAGTHSSVNIDASISANVTAIRAAVGETVSLASGLVGDLNGDSRVNNPDLSTFYKNFGLKQARYYQGDLTGDGNVNNADLSIFRNALYTKLFAPSDFDRDRDVDGNDLATIGEHWNQSVAAFSAGDADGNGHVNSQDVAVFDRNQRRGMFGPLPLPLGPVAGDLDGNGLIDGTDIAEVNRYLNQRVPIGMSGDINRNGQVDINDVTFVLLHSGDSFGDIDGDHAVGPSDFAILASRWNQSVTGGRFQGDMNYDGIVNALDATVLFQWWSAGAGGFAPVVAPEPTAAGIALVGGLLLRSGLRRRRPL